MLTAYYFYEIKQIINRTGVRSNIIKTTTTTTTELKVVNPLKGAGPYPNMDVVSYK